MDCLETISLCVLLKQVCYLSLKVSFTHSKTWECQIMNVYKICSNGKIHSLFEQQSKRHLLIGEKGFCFSS